jgi:hypothetical protein
LVEFLGAQTAQTITADGTLRIKLIGTNSRILTTAANISSLAQIILCTVTDYNKQGSIRILKYLVTNLSLAQARDILLLKDQISHLKL